MSGKLPIGDTVNEAFLFGLKRWATVLRFAWAPVLVSGLIMMSVFSIIFDFKTIFSNAEQAATLDFDEILRVPVGLAIVLVLAAYGVATLLLSGVMASIFRLVALGEDRSGIFHLRMDGPALRVFFSFVIIFIANVLIWGIALTLVLTAQGHSFADLAAGFYRLFEAAITAKDGAKISPDKALALFEPIQPFFIAMAYAAIPLLYVNLKLTPFPAGTAAENRLILFRSFAITTGHWWSIFGSYVLFVLAMIIISIIFQIVIAIFHMLKEGFFALGPMGVLFGAIIGVAVFCATTFFELFTAGVQLALRAIIYRRLATGE